jgi:hypothetical protein
VTGSRRFSAASASRIRPFREARPASTGENATETRDGNAGAGFFFPASAGAVREREAECLDVPSGPSGAKRASISRPARKEATMSKILDQVLSANAAYARDFGDRENLAMPPSRGFAILTCMDARLDPAKYAGLAEGDAHVVRNAGGRASDDAIRSLVISHKMLGTREWFVVHHTDCGMETFTDEVIRRLLASSLQMARLGPTAGRTREAAADRRRRSSSTG